ncbi:electron transport complex subunit RsxC [Sansalvadorimonas sp. 2012CJ34-2]|uniref:Ion-translocating oxidoreductase complex subunit C n=1 Tax=Parendozoicomonas callyspongiae TaxID=2942213 RepID=A0ABT0PHW2_9GAMM|nr:electron transport complex subunit RsxC [Sansalvadorimonas sp. 2012CJ34-2]MCL6270977.1 electron transport complex subunit RsxC [Sansalvadorimonas sp. 2012CJ34-2]
MSSNPSQGIPLRTIHEFPGGVHPGENKEQSTRTPIATPPLPNTFILPLNQHSGAPAELLVKVGDYVLKGQMLARANGFVSSPVHAPTSGTVTSVGMHPVPHWSGLEETCLVLEADGKDQWCELDPVADYKTVEKDELVQCIHDAGIVGLGGAGFPAAVKMSSRKASKIHTLIVNGAECEPYITADDMLMRERADRLLGGIEILQHMLNPQEVLIGIEDNKPEAIEAMRKVCAGKDAIEVVPVPTKYPSGDAQRLIWLLTGKEVPSDARSVDIGMLCYNVGTLVAIYDAITEGKPLISRVTTLTGAALHQPGNVEALIGTPAEHLLEFAGIQDEQFDALVMGGPMMGHTLDTTAVPVIKTSNCFIAASREEFPPPPPEQACIRCGMCADACPLSLLPQQLYWHAKSQNHEQLHHHNLFDCIECGACSYVCPSSIPLVQYFRAGKDEIRFQKAKSEKAERSRQRFEQRQKRLEAVAAEKEARRKANAEKARRAKEAKAAAGQSAGQNSADTSAADAKADMIKAAMERAKAKKATRAAGTDVATASSGKPARPQLSPKQKELKIQLSVVNAQIKKCERAASQAGENSSPEAEKLQADIDKLKQQQTQLKAEFEAASAPTEAPAKPAKAELSADEKKHKIELAMARAAVKKAERAVTTAKESDSDQLQTLQQQLEDKRRELARCEEAV